MELFERSLSELLALLRGGRLSVRELCGYFAGRCKRIGGTQGLNAVSRMSPSWEEDACLLDRSGDRSLPLFGIPFLVKENIDLKGLPTTAGSMALTDNFPEEDAPVVRKLKQAGAVCLGKTNMTELANWLTQGMPNGYSSLGGQVLNAYDPAGDPGGSSSGSGVAVSCGLVPFALGTDTSFSVVGCAALNGVFGYKPMHTNMDMHGVVPISDALDTTGVFCRRFGDLLRVLEVLPEKAPTIRFGDGIRFGLSTWRREIVSKEQMRRYASVFDRIAQKEDIGHTHTDRIKDLMTEDFTPSLERYFSGAGTAIKTAQRLYDRYRADPEHMMRYGAKYLEEAIKAAAAPEHEERLRELLLAQKELRTTLERELAAYDAVLMTGSDATFHFAGLPSIAIPFCLETDGLPRCMILYSLSEDRLLGAAGYLVKRIGTIPFPAAAYS